MVTFLKRLFGGDISAAKPTSAHPSTAAVDEPAKPSIASASEPASAHGTRGGQVEDRVSDRYFELSAVIERGKADQDYRSAIAAARETYAIMSQFVRECQREYGRFDIRTSHAVHTAPTLMAVLEDREGIRELRAALEGERELREWLPSAEQAEADIELVVGIMGVVRREPGLAQSGLKAHLGVADGRRVSQLAAWLEKAGRIRRVKKGSSLQLYPTVATDVSAVSVSTALTSTGPPPQPSTRIIAPVLRSRPRRSPLGAREIDLAALPYVRLPKAPAHWERRQQQETEDHADRVWAETVRVAEASLRRASAPQAAQRFAADGEGWRILSEHKLAPEQRPAPRLQRHLPDQWLDVLARSPWAP